MKNSLKDKLEEIFPNILPKNPNEALTSSQIIQKIKETDPDLYAKYAEGSFRQHFSDMSKNPTTSIARVKTGHGYYLRSKENQQTFIDIPATIKQQVSRDEQPEEKFRSLFIYHSEQEGRFPVHIEHTKGKKLEEGRNKWKFPDVLVIDWEQMGEIEDGVYKLNPDILEVKRSIGEQPFRIISVELKIKISFSNLREYFFQCVSNSKWAHEAQLVIAQKIEEQALEEELRRLGTSYDVTILSYNLTEEEVNSLPNAQKTGGQNFALEDKIREITQISSGKVRQSLDWEHIRDMQNQHIQFTTVFEWIAYCLQEKISYSFTEYEIFKSTKNKRQRNKS